MDQPAAARAQLAFWKCPLIKVIVFLFQGVYEEDGRLRELLQRLGPVQAGLWERCWRVLAG